MGGRRGQSAGQSIRTAGVQPSTLVPTPLRKGPARARAPTSPEPQGRNRPQARTQPGPWRGDWPPRRWRGWPRRSPRPPETGCRRRIARMGVEAGGDDDQVRAKASTRASVSKALRQVSRRRPRGDRVGDVGGDWLIRMAAAGPHGPLLDGGQEQAVLPAERGLCRCRGARRSRRRPPSFRPGHLGGARRWRRWRRCRSPSAGPARRGGLGGRTAQKARSAFSPLDATSRTACTTAPAAGGVQAAGRHAVGVFVEAMGARRLAGWRRSRRVGAAMDEREVGLLRRKRSVADHEPQVRVAQRIGHRLQPLRAFRVAVA